VLRERKGRSLLHHRRSFDLDQNFGVSQGSLPPLAWWRLAANVGEPIESVRLVAPETPEHELEKLARTIRRVVLAALVDRHAELEETREQLRAGIEGCGIRTKSAEPQAV
jgi:hypothetical protein